MFRVARSISVAALMITTAVPTLSAQPYGFYYPGPTYRNFQAPPRYYGRPGVYSERGRYARPYDDRRRYNADDDDDDDDDDKPRGPKVMDGGGRPEIRPIAPQSVAFSGSYAPGTIIIDTKGRQLLLVTGAQSAVRYPISVGRQGFTWTGTEKISRIADWPDWHPPAEMRERQRELPEKMTGGVKNPLGAKALYLGNSLYRIHGTNDGRTIGQAASSGCFRMMNGHVIDLASRVGVGTAVVVVDRLPPGTIASDGVGERDQRRRN